MKRWFLWQQTSPKRSLIVAVSALSLLMLGACAKPEPIRLGFVSGTTGRVANQGINGRNGAILAVEQRNAAGGIGGRQIELLVRDDEHDADKSRAAFRELIAARVEAIIGPMTSGMAAATVPIANEAKMVTISPIVASADFAGKDDYFFRVVPSTRDYAEKSALYQRRILKAARLAVAYDTSNRSYTESWLTYFRAAFEREGGQLVAVVPFASSADTHFSAVAGQLLASRPEGVVVIANGLDTAMVCLQVRRLDGKIPLAAAEWASSEKLIEVGGQAVEGMTLTQFVDSTSQSPAYLAFHERYLKRFGHVPGFGGVSAYEATHVVLDALAKKPPGQPLKESLLAMRKFPGLQGDIVFDANGDVTRDALIGSVRNGRFAAAGQ